MNHGSNLDDKDKTHRKGAGDDGAPAVSLKIQDEVDDGGAAAAPGEVPESDIAVAVAAADPTPTVANMVSMLGGERILGDPNAIPGLLGIHD
jgi:hypothetical protein